MSQELHVKIGEILKGRPGQVLKSTFGSCVGIALLWREERVYALAHCLLGEAPAGAPLSGAKYVSQALPALIRKLKVPSDRIEELEAVVVGGARMACGSSTAGPAVGELNIRAAKAHAARLKFRRVSWDVGGELATQIRIDCATGEVTVRRVDAGKEDSRAAS